MIETWQNECGTERWWNTGRPLTRSLDLGEEGLAMQATRTCSVTDCDQIHHALGLCRKHHNQQSYDKRRVPGGRVYAQPGPCQIEDCDGTAKARGWCGTHYQRFLRTGSPTGVVPRRARGTCTMADCDNLHAAHGYCATHLSRWKNNGDPNITRRDWAWVGDEVRYIGAHTRIRTARGSASDHPCVDCGSAAAEWSYDHRDPDEKTEAIGTMVLAYSVKIEHYQPRCRSCHKLFDNRVSR